MAPRIRITFKDDKDGSVTEVEAALGTSVLEVAHANDIDLEGARRMLVCWGISQAIAQHPAKGACEGSLACSTCHVIVEVGAGAFRTCCVCSC